MKKQNFSIRQKLQLRFLIILLIYTLSGLIAMPLLEYIFSRFENQVSSWLYLRLDVIYFFYLVAGLACIFYHYWRKPWDYLEYVAALKDVPARETTKKINHLLDVLTLSDVKGKKIAKLFGGMKRRVGIAQAMLNDPKILVMDEPTAGLDPGEQVRFRNFISEFSHDRIVLISTHIVSDIEYIATRNAIMKAGKIVDIGRADELVREIEGKVWTCAIPTRDLVSSAAVEIPVFLFLAVRSYCKHQVA